MKAVYVNLDRAVDRRARVEEQASRYGFEVERLEAVDGNAIPLHERSAIQAATRLSVGAIGCFLSHRRAWEMATREKHLAIFEDDVRFSPSIPQFLADASWIPADADIVRLEKKQGKPVAGATSVPALDRHLRRLYGKDAGTAGYIISGDCAAILLTRLTRLTEEFDQILFNTRSPICRSLRIYKLYPSLCVQDQKTFESSIERTSLLPRFAQNLVNKAQRGLDRMRAPEPAQRFTAEFR